MKFRLLYKNFFIVLFADVILLTASMYFAHLIRFDYKIPKQHWLMFKKMAPVFLSIKIITFYYFDLYRGMWRYTSISDLINIIKASCAGTLIVICFILFSPYRFVGFPRSVFIIDCCFLIITFVAARLLRQWRTDRMIERRRYERAQNPCAQSTG